MKRGKTALWVFLIFSLFIPANCDMAYIPSAVSPDNSPEKENGSPSGEDNSRNIDELKARGHYLVVCNLSPNVRPENISDLKVSDGTAQVAFADAARNIVIELEPSYANMYIPLAASDGSPFSRTGSFYVEFSIVIDALTKVVFSPDLPALVPFSDGSGSLDVTNNIPAPRKHLVITGLPQNVRPENISGFKVSDGTAQVAFTDAARDIVIELEPSYANMYVPLADSDGSPFSRTGSFYVEFSIVIDALTRFIIGPDLPALIPFSDGSGLLDISNIPAAPHAYLTITGLPQNVRPENISGLKVSDGTALAAFADAARDIVIELEPSCANMYVPLADSDGSPFSRTGSFYVEFSIVIDALTRFIIAPDLPALVPFSDGSGSLDISNIPAAPHAYLTITGLPPNTQEMNISGVFVLNQVGIIAKCENYSLLTIDHTGGSPALNIPLVYADTNQIFAETGPFYVAFDLNTDALTRIQVTTADELIVNFMNGNGALDTAALPQPLPASYLTFIGLPANTDKNNFSDVFVYNTAGRVAKGGTSQNILISKGADSVTAMVPLFNYDSSSEEYFRSSGAFIVTFTINIDINTQLVKTRDDAFTSQFTNGSSLVDLSVDLGYFSGGLANPDDTSPPVIKKGTVFEINGSYVEVKNNTAVPALTLSASSLVYIYASFSSGSVYFEYSTATPAFVPAKGGYYVDNKRALFKFAYLRDSTDKYAAKTLIGDPWPQFAGHSIANLNLGGYSYQAYSLSGSGNPSAKTVTLQAGGYVIVLKGAGGGGAGGVAGYSDGNITSSPIYGGAGGGGGYIAEFVTLSSGTSFTAFTGQGGNGGSFTDNWLVSPGTGGGGGGSGTFVYSSGGYFLCAGGGGGGGGVKTAAAGGGGGGAGGAIGSGGGGGKGGNVSWTLMNSTTTYTGTSGGVGGGYSGYTLSSGNWGFNGSGSSGTTISADLFGTAGSNGGTAAYDSSGTFKNTNNANGQGANGNASAGGSGGNNRNTTRGGGAAGGAAGSGANGGKGSDGSIVIYRVF
jgi:hypothetical protein